MRFGNTFSGAVMNKDLDKRFIPKDQYLNAENVRIVSNSTSNNRAVRPLKSTTSLTSISLGDNAVCVGVCIDSGRNKIYWAVSSDTGSFIYEYDTSANTSAKVLADTRALASRVLNFGSSNYVEMAVLNDNDNNRNFLFVTDGLSEPLYFDIAAAKALSQNAFELLDISLIKRPPLSAPTVVLSDDSTDVNYIEDKFIQFAYRYRYEFGEYSALSPFSEYAFLPKTFEYNFLQASNTSMNNKFNTATVTYNTGPAQVKEIELVYKESGSDTVYIIERINKSEKSLLNNADGTLVFKNNKVFRVLDPNQTNRLFDNVPTSAATLALIGNRLVLGNYTENYDLGIAPDLSLSYNSATGTEGASHTTVKTNRDYEVAISYLDGKGRMTTPLVSSGNAVYIPSSVADQKNTLEVTIGNQAPEWATNYRLFIKQNQTVYDVITPVIFYRDSSFAYLRLEGTDQDKVKAGDFIYVKSDTSGFRSTLVKTPVLEVEEKTRNFLQPDPTVETTFQTAGVYMKLEIKGFSLSTEGFKTFISNIKTVRQDGTTQAFGVTLDYVEDPVFYGTGVNDLSVTSGDTYNSDEDIRYIVSVTDASSTPNKVSIRAKTISDLGVADVLTENVDMSLTPINCGSNGVQIQWGATTGHTETDYWVISAKSEDRSDEWQSGGESTFPERSTAIYPGKKPGDEVIPAGSVITIRYDEAGTTSDDVDNKLGFFDQVFISTVTYANLEEWFYGDNILTQLSHPKDETNPEKFVMFRRGTLASNSQGADSLRVTITGSQSDALYMIIATSSRSEQTGTKITVTAEINIQELDDYIIFETVPTEVVSDVFYELPTTYSITSRNHQGGSGDTKQIHPSQDAVITLDFSNAYGWYNGYESIKIADNFLQKVALPSGRPSAAIDDYREITRVASLTYSDVYEGTTQFNAINEFNLSEANYKDMDTRYGAIRKLNSEDTNLEVYQDDKTHRVLYNKSVLFNADGSGNVSQNVQVLGQEVAYSGEYGISGHPESWAQFGNRRYHYDRERGALLRLSNDGYTEISQRGMHEFFRGLFNRTTFVGGYDPFFDEYLITTSSGKTLGWSEVAAEGGGFTSFYSFAAERLVGINNRLYSFKDAQLWRHDDGSTYNTLHGVEVDAKISTVVNDEPLEMKFFRSLNVDTDSSNWDVTVRTNLNTSTIDKAEWEQEEGEYHAWIRQYSSTAGNEAVTTPLFVYTGLGEFVSITDETVTVDTPELSRTLAVGNDLYFYNGSIFLKVGEVVSYSGSTITVDAVANTPTAGQILVCAKSARIEGEPVRGYYLQVDLTNDATTEWELFAVKTEASSSLI